MVCKGIIHHEGTKDTKVSDKLYSELRALRVFMVRMILTSF